MNLLGNGLSDAKHHEAALSVRETDLATRRRLGADEESILITQNNLANTYQTLGWLDEALQLKRDVYSGHLKLFGEENIDTLISANNYAPRPRSARWLARSSRSSSRSSPPSDSV